jgi:prepilin signal peptidase PulO-like enzyme (type II secretory pathway)
VNNWIELSVFLLFAIPIAIFDLREYRIPDLLTLGGILVFTLLKLLWDREPIWLVAAEGAAGFGVFWLIRLVTKGKMGLGDAKFSAMIAIAAGFFFWLAALTIASIAGLVIAVILIGRRKMTRGQRIPFAPFLGFGAAAALVLQAVAAGPITAALSSLATAIPWTIIEG